MKVLRGLILPKNQTTFFKNRIVRIIIVFDRECKLKVPISKFESCYKSFSNHKIVISGPTYMRGDCKSWPVSMIWYHFFSCFNPNSESIDDNQGLELVFSRKITKISLQNGVEKSGNCPKYLSSYCAHKKYLSAAQLCAHFKNQLYSGKSGRTAKFVRLLSMSGF